MNKIVELNEQTIGGIASGVLLTILPDHHWRCGCGIVLSRSVDPVIRKHAFIEFAGMDKFFTHFALRDTGLLIRLRAKSRDIETTAEALAIDDVVVSV